MTCFTCAQAQELIICDLKNANYKKCKKITIQAVPPPLPVPLPKPKLHKQDQFHLTKHTKVKRWTSRICEGMDFGMYENTDMGNL